jgi:hypothetical protein
MSIVLAAVYFAVAVGLHAVWCRLPPGLSSVIKYIGVGGIVGVALVVHLFSRDGWSASTLAGVLCFALASELYLFLSTLVHSSVSAVWLRRLRRGSMEAEAMAKLYDPAWMVASRFERLTENGFLAPAHGSHQLTPKARKVLRIFGSLRAFFGHDRRDRERLSQAAGPVRDQ